MSIKNFKIFSNIFIQEGAEGLLQAVVLSFAGLQFTSEHLALGTDAEVLHNEIGLSNIRLIYPCRGLYP